MSTAFVLLSTRSTELLAAWRKQCAQFRFIDASTYNDLAAEVKRAGPRVWVVDVAHEHARIECHPDTVKIVVGEPQTIPFEEFRSSQWSPFCLGYEQSERELKSKVELAVQLSETKAENSLLKLRRQTAAPFESPAQRSSGAPISDGRDDLEFSAAAVSGIENRDALVLGFQREARNRLSASRVLVYVKEENQFVGMGAEYLPPCLVNTAMVAWLEESPTMIDVETWEGTGSDSRAEIEIRQYMSSWRARLLMPLLVRNALGGWIAFGPRADGNRYSPADHKAALNVARFLEACLDRHRETTALRRDREDRELARRVLPCSRIVSRADAGDTELPVPVRSAIADVLHEIRNFVFEPTAIAPYRIEAGPCPDGRVWVQWMDCSALLEDQKTTREGARTELMTETLLLMQHELGNSLTALRAVHEEIREGRRPPEDLMRCFNNDLSRLESIQELCGRLNSTKADAFSRVRTVDIADFLRSTFNMKAVAKDDAPDVLGDLHSLRSAFAALVNSAFPSQGFTGDAAKSAVLEITRKGDAGGSLAIFTLSGMRALPEGLLDLRGRRRAHADMGIFVAREVLVRHGGALRIVEGIRAPEIVATIPALAITAHVPTAPSAGHDTRMEIGAYFRTTG